MFSYSQHQISEPGDASSESAELIFLVFNVLLISVSVFLLYQKRLGHKVSSRAAKQQVVRDLVKKRLAEIFTTGTRSTEAFFTNNLENSKPEVVVSEVVKQIEEFLRPKGETCFDTIKAAETAVIKLLALLNGADSQVLAVIFPRRDENIRQLQQGLNSLQLLYSDLEKQTKEIMQQESPPRKSLCALRDRYLKCGLTVPTELYTSIEHMKESERQAKGMSLWAGPF